MNEKTTSRRRRPTALEVSFRDDKDVQIPEPIVQIGSLKREASRHGEEVKNKRAHIRSQPESSLPIITRQFDPNSIVDSDVNFLPFEERASALNSDLGNSETEQDKPIRELNDFTFADATNGYLVPLHVGFERSLRGEGLVSAYIDGTDEDEGQDDELTEDTVDSIRMTLKEVAFIKLDFGPNIFVETSAAFYLLREPSNEYRVFHNRFVRLVSLTRLIVTACRTNRHIDTSRSLFQEKGLLKAPYSDYDMSDVVAAKPIIKYALTFLHDCKALQVHPTIKKLCLELGFGLPTPNPWFPPQLTGNIDVKVLHPDNQTQTVATPYLAELATGLFQERMDAVGIEGAKLTSHAHSLHANWREQFRSTVGRRKAIMYPGRSQEYVRIDGVEYRPGDALFVPADYSLRENYQIESSSTPQQESTLFDEFWIALIVSLDKDTDTIHVVWLEHSSQTLLGQLHDPRMVFITDICDRLPVQCVLGKAAINFAQLSDEQLRALGDDEFYCWLKYNAHNGSMSSTNITELISAIKSQQCLLCRKSDKEDDSVVIEIEGGLLFHNQRYHINDFALIRRETDDGPANIGRITRIASPKAIHRKDPYQVTITKLGRIRDVQNLPSDTLVDERHLFLTNDTEIVPAERLIGVVYVLHIEQVPRLDIWLEHSPHHFYIEHQISLQESSYYWGSRELLAQDAEDLKPCAECYKKRFDEVRQLHNFTSRKRQAPLRALDLFSGVGAFSAGIVDGTRGCITVTHAIEITPSAAKTCARNSPHTTVYNQCANTMLKWCIKTLKGHDVKRPTQIYDNRVPVGNAIEPGDIDVIICGVPCQPHSALNMYKRANDKKAHLIVNFLSWVDFLKPRFVFMENVRGFTTFRLNAVQYDRYRVGGGIEAGGLKFIYHALTQLGYQVRCGLLQAGHYGVPQTRVRFFLVAAKQGEKLPQFPQPSHDFARIDGLEIVIPRPLKGTVGSIWTTRGTAAHHFVSIADAIGDLPRFDWMHPNPTREPQNLQNVTRQRRTLKIPTFQCHDTFTKCGFTGSVKYANEKPQTRFQQWARTIRTEDIQHYTMKLPERRVEQVLSIPLKPNADYQSIPQYLGDWMLMNQSSALARHGYKPGKYFGRLDQNKWFNTTVTNLHPTAKQSKVLHPTDRRMYTVREFARSMSFRDDFVFESINDSVVTLHRQIGNAVPWLLAKAIGAEFLRALFEQELEELELGMN